VASATYWRSSDSIFIYFAMLLRGMPLTLEQVKSRVVIEVDNRERRSGVPAALEDRGWSVMYGNLPAADYVLDIIGIERKTVPDFVQSVTNGRFFSEAAKMVEAGFSVRVILVEGDYEEIVEAFGYNQANGTVASLLERTMWGNVIPVGNQHNLIGLMEMIFWKTHDGKDRTAEAFLARKVSKYASEYEVCKNILMGIPKVGPDAAIALLKHFGTIEAMTRATEKELKAVKGIGPVLADTIYLHLHFDYNESPI